MTYHDLNLQANAVARHLIANGFRRGGYAVVRMPRGVELAAVLLGVLKAGGSYLWLDATSTIGYPVGVSIANGSPASEQEQFLAIDVVSALRARVSSAPNLPILTRGSDIACILPDQSGSAAVFVPHETITSLSMSPAENSTTWAGEQGAFDLWLSLMRGQTLMIGDVEGPPMPRAA